MRLQSGVRKICPQLLDSNFTDKNRVRMKILVYDIKGSGMMPEQSGEMKWKW